MNPQRVTTALASLVVATLTLSVLAPHSWGQPDDHRSTLPDWQEQAQSRFKAIYKRGEFNPPAFRPTWLADSSAYRLRERDPENNRRRIWQYDVATGKRTAADDNQAADQSRSANGKYKLETQKGVLTAVSIEGDQRIELVRGPADRDVSFRNLRWSPSGKFISFVQVDNTEVRWRSVLVPTDPSYPDVTKRRFARVGGKIPQLRVGMVELESQEVNWLSVAEPEEEIYLGQVDWIPDADALLVEKLSRFRDVREFWIADADTETLDRIYRETNDAWAVGSHQINSGATWINGGKELIYISEKDGWRHAYRMSRDGQQETKLTSGEYDIIDRAFIDESGGGYYFYASPDNATQKYLYRVALDGEGELNRVTPEGLPGTHDYDVSPDRKWAFHTYSTINDPPIIQLIRLPDHKTVRQVREFKRLHTRAKQAIQVPTEFVMIDLGDDVTMDASITKPSDFDASKSYPIFVYVYGEPYLQTVLDRWGAAQIHFHRVVADMGYVVVSIDNRGTACPKGAQWRRSIFGSLGPLSTEDQAAALKALASKYKYLDLERVGIWGWSGGGSNTLNAMFRQPDLYDVGIAVVPKPQPWLYNAWFQEIYMRTREVNPDGYQRSAPINFAEGLQGKLLIITGSGETNTHIQIIEGLVDRLIELGKAFDYMVYPNRDHGLREGAGSVVHVRMLILRYLLENLPPGPK